MPRGKSKGRSKSKTHMKQLGRKGGQASGRKRKGSSKAEINDPNVINEDEEAL
jgi:general stress protein YciG